LKCKNKSLFKILSEPQMEDVVGKIEISKDTSFTSRFSNIKIIFLYLTQFFLLQVIFTNYKYKKTIDG